MQDTDGLDGASFTLAWPGAVGAGLALLTATLLWLGVIPAPLSFHALLLAGIAWVYIGFALLDGRPRAVAIESVVAAAFFAMAYIGLAWWPFLLAIGFAGHGLWDLVHHDAGITTAVPRWYPRFCAVYDFAHAVLFVALGFAAAS